MDPEHKLTRIVKWEYIVPALAIGSLIVSCVIVSSKKYFSNDELYSYYLLSDCSLRHMMVAFSDKFTQTPPLYFVFGWLWARAFGATELSLRLFSSFGISIACLVVWVTLRRNYQFWPATIGTLGIFCVSDLILAQNAEARMYGLFLAFCSLGILQADIISRRQDCGRNALVLNMLIHVAIVQTHLLGIIYSGVILCAFIIRDRLFTVFRPKVYLSVLVSWLSLIPYLPTFFNQADAGNPRAWIPIPGLKSLTSSLIPSVSPLFSLVIVFLLIVSVIQFVFMAADSRHARLSEQRLSKSAAEVSLLVLGCLCIAVPVGVWIISHTIKPLFVERYMIPGALGWSVLLAYLCSRIVGHPAGEWARVSVRMGSGALLLALTAILLMHPITFAWTMPKNKFPGVSDGKYGYSDLPIVTSSSHDFMQRFHYSPERQRYFFLLDWEAALDTKRRRPRTWEYKTKDALKREYHEVFEGNIVQVWDFLRTHDRFLVLDADYQGATWLDIRIKKSPDYKISALGQVDDKQLFLVEKK
jgi:uncharacterized membrane protein YsdA (DUF1294 family)